MSSNVNFDKIFEYIVSGGRDSWEVEFVRMFWEMVRYIFLYDKYLDIK